MEFLLPPLIAVLPSIIAFILFLYFFHRKTSATNKRPPPEASGAWPLIGHLRLLSGPEPVHKVLGALADKHGPIFTIRLGVHRALVVSDSDIAKECFTGSNDKVFSNRPKSIAVEHLSLNYTNFGFSPYGPYWREMRKITMLELLSNHRLSMLSHVTESEVKNSVKNIYEMWVKEGNCLVEIKKWFDEITLKLAVKIIAELDVDPVYKVELVSKGKMLHKSSSYLFNKTIIVGNVKIKDGEGYREAFKEFFKLMGVFTVGDAIPFLRWLDLGGYENAMKKTAKKLDDMLQEWLEEHKRQKNSGKVPETEKDFMQVMLEILDGGKNEDLNFDADTTNKGTCLGLTLGGADTTTTTLTWAVALLLNNPFALKKAQEELDTHIGGQRQVEESDIKDLVYIQAIVKETLRLYPPSQLLPPRENTENCVVGGYHVPTGTRLFVNMWKIHRDPSVWPDSWEFRPERFLTTHKDVDLKGRHFEFIPFGSGRRVCPGISFALQVVQFMLASFLHAFEITTPTSEPVDMTETFGFANIKAMPLEVFLTPRLSPEVYRQVYE